LELKFKKSEFKHASTSSANGSLKPREQLKERSINIFYLMKILNAIHAQGIGGVDQVFRNYAEVLADLGHEVALLISDNGNDKYATKKIFKLKNSSQLFDVLQLLWILIFFRPDVVFCHSNRVMKWMRIMRFFSRAKSVAVNHGITFKHSLNCQYVVSINQQIADMVTAAGHDKAKSFVLPNVIKVDEKYRSKKIKTPTVIGIYGRIEPRKGFDILIKAAEILQKSNIDFRLKIGGFEVHKHYNLATLQELAKIHNIAEKCQFVGVVLDKKKFFEDVDIFCVPSREEPFGLVILEGFLHSTLVISSDTDGGKFLIEDGKNGIIFTNEDFVDLAKKIEDTLRNREISGDITQKAFLRLEEKFSFAFLAREMKQILQRIIQC
jgi:glycosyltransferase involved in cell wall biosynthesis